MNPHVEDGKRATEDTGVKEEQKAEAGGEGEEESLSQVASPTIVIAITGPSKVGKPTLLRGLVKSSVQQRVSQLNRPITIVTGKRNPITFVEVPNQLTKMIDAAKVADYVLLLIDAPTGYEMETFEFINILQVYGMLRVMGVLTHLDLVTKASQLRSAKRTLKHRLWTGHYKGAKLFHLSRLVNTAYPKQEVTNLARFLSVARIQPVPWRTLRPYMLCDRIEDLTDPELVRREPLFPGGAQAFKQNKTDRGEIMEAMKQLQGTIDAKVHDAPLELLQNPNRIPNGRDIQYVNARQRNRRHQQGARARYLKRAFLQGLRTFADRPPNEIVCETFLFLSIDSCSRLATCTWEFHEFIVHHGQLLRERKEQLETSDADPGTIRQHSRLKIVCLMLLMVLLLASIWFTNYFGYIDGRDLSISILTVALTVTVMFLLGSRRSGH